MTVLGLLRGANKNNKDFLATIEDGNVMTLGRNEESDIVISWPIISDLHCEIHTTWKNNIAIVYLTDKSINGTYLNGSLIGFEKTVILFAGCIISFASEHLNLIYVEIKSSQSSLVDQYTIDFDSEASKHKKKVTTSNKRIGFGGQAEALLAYDYYRTRHELVCRCVYSRSYINILYGQSSMDTEIQVLKKFKHINVLSMITTHLHPYDNRITCSFFPLYAGGTLNDRIERKGSLEESEAAFIFYQILSGLQYIHKMGIIHCDIKVENIFLSSQSSKTRAVIADFGLAIEQSKRQKEWRDDEYGTRHNYAPEMIQRKEFDERIDVWCAGIVLYRMLCGSHPFMKTIETRHSIIDDWKVFSTRVLQMHPNMKRERIKRVSDEGKFFIYSLLEKDFRCRPTSTKALRDPFILWQISLNDGEFFANYDTYVRKDFVQERSRWFDDEKYIKVDKKPDYHPDWNEQDVEDIRYHRASDSPAPIFTSKKPVRFDVGYEEESYNKTMAERFPKRSFLEKKRKIEEGYQQEEEGFSVGS